MREKVGQRQEKQTQEETNRDGGRQREMLSFFYRSLGPWGWPSK